MAQLQLLQNTLDFRSRLYALSYTLSYKKRSAG